MCGKLFYISITFETLGITNETWNPMATFIHGTLGAAHTCIKSIPSSFDWLVANPGSSSVIRHVNDYRIVELTVFFKLLKQPSDVAVDAVDHSVKCRHRLLNTLVEILLLERGRHVVRAMRSIKR